MTDDQPDQPEQFNNDGGGGRRGGGGTPGGGLLALLPLLIRIFGVKGILVIGAIAIGGYFFLGREGCGNIISQASGSLATGGILDPQQFEKANIYEALDPDDIRNPLPEAANLQRYAPAVGNQGQQGSCVGWSSAYAARTILESGRSGANAEQIKFSPAFLYNQIGLDGCQGSYLVRAMEFMTKQGSVPYDAFPYTDQDCTQQPPNSLVQQASQFRMRGFNRLTKGNTTDEIDMRAIKENLAQGAPVVIGMMVGESYMQNMIGKDVWRPESGDASMMGFGGHAQCVVGYDDKKYGGSFLIMNSWGPQWGNNGFAWVRYPDFKYYVREAYGLEPMAKTGTAANAPFVCEIGLVEVAYDGTKTVRKNYIPLKTLSANRFETTAPVEAGTRFKMEVKNTTECYTYVLGKETDGTSYTLFPYPEKDDPTKTRYSPFCGITGSRLFPKDKSMMPDSIGNRDIMAIVVSKKPLDWYQLNKTISQQPGTDYSTRVANALRSQNASGIRYTSTSSGAIRLEGPANENQVAGCIVEVIK
ncbi:MAG: C1 family peptidase [Chitinophagaceae bacterium]|nr:C1 family peptidase [Chitinophagaceae bacterium]